MIRLSAHNLSTTKMASKKLFGRNKQQQQTFTVPEGFKTAGVFYIRVSTSKQEAKGNGLEAQRAAILDFAAQEKIYQIGDFFVEALSGKLEDRPKLLEAFALAKAHDAYLVTSKLDRLSRNSAFINNLIEKNFKFVTKEYGFDYDPLILRIVAAINQNERERIAQRTKDGLAQVKRRYEDEYQEELKTNPNAIRKRLGTPPEKMTDLHVSRVAKREALDDAIIQYTEIIKPTIDEMYLETGKTPSLVKVSERLNDKGLKNKYGNSWSPAILYRLIGRLKESGDYYRLNDINSS